MHLNILISTYNNRINMVKDVILNYRDDVSYIVSHQYTDEKYKIIPQVLYRKDIFISQIEGKGVTKSRNNVIRLANADIGLFSDDDVTYTNDYFDTVLNSFRNNPNLDLALFKIKTPDGFPEYKKYPDAALRLRKLPFSVGTIEIAIKIKKIKEFGVLFDERFGAGQPLLIGSDESIFVYDCIRKGLNCWFFPNYIVNHPFESTIKLIPKYDIRRTYVSGAADARMYGWLSVPRTFLATIKHIPQLIKNKKNPFIYISERLNAVFYILLNRDSL